MFGRADGGYVQEGSDFDRAVRAADIFIAVFRVTGRHIAELIGTSFSITPLTRPGSIYDSIKVTL